MTNLSTASANVEALYRYPVKGLSPQALEHVDLSPGRTIAFDRRWAIQDGRGRFDPRAPKHLPKINYLMLMRDEALAALETHFDEKNSTLTIFLGGQEVARGDLLRVEGRAKIEDFLAHYMHRSLHGAPKIVSAEGHSISDVAEKCVHIVNCASIQELSKAASRDINPLRFRPNIVLEGWPAWFEFSLIGQEIDIGTARFKVFSKTVRCAATNVDPDTGARDMALPDLLLSALGHTNFGIYAQVISSGRISRGDHAVAV